jgi:hypothetical protein
MTNPTPPDKRFQPTPESAVKAPVMPQQQPDPSQAPAVQQAGTSREPKNAFEDPSALKFMVEFFSGAGSKRLVMAAPNAMSASIAAFFIAFKHFPEIHTFGVWQKTGPGPEDIGECTCYVAMANILPFCSQELAELTGKKVATPAVPIITAQAGFEELGKQLKAKGGVKQS